MKIDKRIRIDFDEDEIKTAIISYLKISGFNTSKNEIDLNHDKSNPSGFAAGVTCIALCTDTK